MHHIAQRQLYKSTRMFRESRVRVVNDLCSYSFEMAFTIVPFSCFTSRGTYHATLLFFALFHTALPHSSDRQSFDRLEDRRIAAREYQLSSITQTRTLYIPEIRKSLLNARNDPSMPPSLAAEMVE